MSTTYKGLNTVVEAQYEYYDRGAPILFLRPPEIGRWPWPPGPLPGRHCNECQWSANIRTRFSGCSDISLSAEVELLSYGTHLHKKHTLLRQRQNILFRRRRFRFGKLDTLGRTPNFSVQRHRHGQSL